MPPGHRFSGRGSTRPVTPTRPAPDAPSRRLAALVVALAVVLAGAVGALGPLRTGGGIGSPAAAQSPGSSTSDPEQAAAGWLARQLDAGRIGDVGLLTDTVLALYGAGVARASADAALDRIPDSQVQAWVTPSGDFQVGPAGKSLLTRAAAGRSQVWAGIDLEAGLRASMRTTGPRAGEFPASRDATVGSGFNQALAMLGLARTPGGVPPEAVAWLLTRQCPGGGFPDSYGLIGACSQSTGHVDATAMAIMALHAVPNTPVVAEARARAASWLVSIQNAAGGWGDNGRLPPNTNSTGLAGNALRAEGRTAAVEEAVRFVTARQLGCGRGEAERGAIVWASTTDSAMIDQTRRATAQALLALGAPPYGSIVAPATSVAAPTLDCPVDTRPGDTQPGDTQPGDTQPGDTRPGDTQPGDTRPGDTRPGDTRPGDTRPPGNGTGHGDDGGGGTGGSGRTGGGQDGAGQGGTGAGPVGDPSALLPDLLRRRADGPATGAESPDETDPERPADEPADEDEEVVARDRRAEEDTAGPLDAATAAARPRSVRAVDDTNPIGPAVVAGVMLVGLLVVVGARTSIRSRVTTTKDAAATPPTPAASTPPAGPDDGSGTRTEDLPGYV